MRFGFLIWLLGVAVAFGGNGEKIVEAARKQIGVTVTYDPAYVSMAYPGGDVPEGRGVCTDVVVRALRVGLGVDLQKAVHEDMKANFSKYPKIWGLKGTDRNIDHRRVPNLRMFFARKYEELNKPEGGDFSKLKAGDLVTCTVAGKLPHIMIVSDRKTSGGRPLVIHNIGSGVREEDRLAEFPITGVYRMGE